MRVAATAVATVFGSYAGTVPPARERPGRPLWLLATILVALLVAKGLVDGFTVLDTGLAILVGTAVIAIIFSFASVVQKRLTR